MTRARASRWIKWTSRAGPAALAAVTCLAGSLAAGACGDVAAPPAPAEPFNSCPANPCSAYSGEQAPDCVCLSTGSSTASAASASTVCTSGGLCAYANSSPLKVLLVVDVPESSEYASGMTFVLTTDMTTSTSNCSSGYCATLPETATATGSLLVDYARSVTAKFNLGNDPSIDTTLPVNVALRPLLSLTPVKGVTPGDAKEAGVILQPPNARQILQVNSPNDGTTLSGPYNGPSVGYAAPIAPGTYAVTISPAAPFDQIFPPFAETATYSSHSPVDLHLLTVDDPRAALAFVASGEATAPLDGFVAYLRDATTHARVSSQVPLRGYNQYVQLHTSGQLDLSNPSLSPSNPTPLLGTLEFVIAPGDALIASGAPAVTYANPVGKLGGLGCSYDGTGAVTSCTPETYPRLPDPANVQGQVLGPDGTPIASDIVLTSVALELLAPIGGGNIISPQFVSYSTTFSTDDNGSYARILPPGTYTALVTPRSITSSTAAANLSASDAAISTVPARTATTLAVASNAAVQAGKTLTLDASVRVEGLCRVADGRALAAASIELKPAASLATATSPLPAPRSFAGVTSLDGHFALLVDPGLYDLSVKPVAGSNLPWVVTTDLLVAPSTAVSLPTQVVPAPLLQPYTLSGPTSPPSAIARALVRAFLPPTGSNVAVEIASGITDDNGQVQLLVAGPPKAAANSTSAP